MRSTTKEDIRISVAVGVAMATLYSAYAALLFIASESSGFSKNGTTIGVVVIVYYVAGILGGVAVGSMLGLRRSWPGALFLSLIAATIFAFCAQTARVGAVWRWQADEWIPMLATALFFGILGAFLLKEK
jgi:hypothetical protein